MYVEALVLELQPLLCRRLAAFVGSGLFVVLAPNAAWEYIILEWYIDVMALWF